MNTQTMRLLTFIKWYGYGFSSYEQQVYFGYSNITNIDVTGRPTKDGEICDNTGAGEPGFQPEPSIFQTQDLCENRSSLGCAALLPGTEDIFRVPLVLNWCWITEPPTIKLHPPLAWTGNISGILNNPNMNWMNSHWINMMWPWFFNCSTIPYYK